ncbi:sulfatase-modifying factor protein [Massilia violaceinigra]|uniref:Sulfatase-modifying factor protein n=1 Tax=Massilia violaceinigra TaxID=2045208 RepID=A0A2D2DQI1_9BURK|nr:sulfatase-modifying factor protein [Massilia violaceinigra]
MKHGNHQHPAGSINLRDDCKQQSWVAALAPFALGKYPVTRSQYAQLSGGAPEPGSTAQHPVVNVSWIDAVRYCNLLSLSQGLATSYAIAADGQAVTLLPEARGYRLPTEAQWEYACRAGTREPRYGELDDIAWYRGNAAGASQPVGLKAANAWGLHDMLGNVWEWCEDLYDPEVYGEYRVFRGGGWDDLERSCLVTNRRRSHPTFAIDDLGFRVARPA